MIGDQKIAMADLELPDFLAHLTDNFCKFNISLYKTHCIHTEFAMTLPVLHFTAHAFKSWYTSGNAITPLSEANRLR